MTDTAHTPTPADLLAALRKTLAAASAAHAHGHHCPDCARLLVGAACPMLFHAEQLVAAAADAAQARVLGIAQSLAAQMPGRA